MPDTTFRVADAPAFEFAYKFASCRHHEGTTSNRVVCSEAMRAQLSMSESFAYDGCVWSPLKKVLLCYRFLFFFLRI